MIRAALLALAFAAPAAAQAHHVDGSFRVDGRILDGRFVDVDDDGARELVLAVRLDDGRRELRVHRLRADGLVDPAPAQVVGVKDDVVCWALADVREEPGRELLFLTRSGAFSYSLTLPGYRDNIARFVEAEMFFDLVDPDGFPEWPYVLERPGGDAVLLAGPRGFVVWAATPDGARIECDLGESQPGGSDGDDGARRRFEIGGGAVAVTASGRDGPGRLPDGHATLPWSPFLSVEHEIHAPALVDVDGDGRPDLVRRDNKELLIHLATEAGLPAEPTRTEPYPESVLGATGMRRDIALEDLDGDGDLDALVRLRDERDGLSLGEITVRFLVMRNDGERLLPEQPTQVLVFEGMSVTGSVSDVDGDGLPDLVVSKVGAPGLADLLTTGDGFTFTRNTLVFLGLGDARFSRTPDVDPPPVEFDEHELRQAISRRLLSRDFDGDGVADQVDVDLDGHITVRRIRKESGFFSGTSWELDADPWRRFDVLGDIRDLDVDDVNGDGLGDVVSLRETSVTLLLSRRTGGAR